jgi:hypothetical protein
VLSGAPSNARLHSREVEYIAYNSGARLLVMMSGLTERLASLTSTVDKDLSSSGTATPIQASSSGSAPGLQSGRSTPRATGSGRVTADLMVGDAIAAGGIEYLREIKAC